MTDADCAAFLQWTLPRLRMRWQGFRRVRRQVCRRIAHRVSELGLPDLAAYQRYLEAQPLEWTVLDGLCTVTISRFYRDKTVFDYLRVHVLPDLAQHALRLEQDLVCWSAGCASGEEAYMLGLIVELALRPHFPRLAFRIVATDSDAHLLRRAQRACYPPGSLKELPKAWRELAFARAGDEYCLKAAFRSGLVFLRQDLRHQLPASHFHLILCRNLVFTYFDADLQREMLAKLVERLHPEGVLVIGKEETLPEGQATLTPVAPGIPIYRKPMD